MKLLRITVACLIFSFYQTSLSSASIVEIVVEKEIVEDNRQTVKNAKQTFQPEITLKSFDAFLKENERFPTKTELPTEQVPRVVIDDVIVFLEGNNSIEEVIVFNENSGSIPRSGRPSMIRG